VPARAEGFVPALREALEAYLEFADVARLEWAPSLSRYARLLGTRLGSTRARVAARGGALTRVTTAPS